MFVKLTELCKNSNTSSSEFTLRETSVNPEHITRLVPAKHFEVYLKEGRLPEKLSKDHQFTTLYINDGHSTTLVTVVGDFDSITEKVGKGRGTQVLKG